MREGSLPKGDALAVARVAGIQAAKRTEEWSRLCPTLPLDQVTNDFHLRETCVGMTSTVRTRSRTGAEMEVLTAVTSAALTLFNMRKAVDKHLRIEAVQVLGKTKEPLSKKAG